MDFGRTILGQMGFILGVPMPVIKYEFCSGLNNAASNFPKQGVVV